MDKDVCFVVWIFGTRVRRIVVAENRIAAARLVDSAVGRLDDDSKALMRAFLEGTTRYREWGFHPDETGEGMAIIMPAERG